MSSLLDTIGCYCICHSIGLCPLLFGNWLFAILLKQKKLSATGDQGVVPVLIRSKQAGCSPFTIQ